MPDVTHPTRRAALRAAGVSLALPWLECLAPRGRARAAGGEPPRRFVGLMTNMGILPEFFFPTGDTLKGPAYLDILKEHHNDLTVFSGVSLPGVDGGHASEKCFLTGAPGASSGSFRNSVSVDQVMAERAGSATRFPSLVLMVGAESFSVSHTRSGSMLPPERSPLKLYQRLFVEDTAEAKAASVRRLKQDRSLLDGVRERYSALARAATPGDRDRLDQFAAGVRELERNLAAAEGWAGRPKPKVSAPAPKDADDANDLERNSRAMLDLVRLALETDSTRVVTVSWNTGSLSPRPLGVNTQCHALTHHGQRPEEIGQLRKIEEAQFRALAGFLGGLKAAREAGTHLLERTSVLFGTNMGSANAHSTDNMPVLLAGGGFQRPAGGKHLAFDRKNNYPLSNVFVTLLQRFGVAADRFASGTGTMRGV